MERTQNSYPLLRQFREFYLELARLKIAAQGKPQDASQIALETAKATAPASASKAGPAAALEAGNPPRSPVSFADDDEAATLRLWHSMASYLDQKMYEVNLSSSSISHDYLTELLYVLAAFADETFVCLIDWPGKDYWSDHLMELRLFHTQIAGQEIFRRIDSLLARKDLVAEELAAVYLMALALGFKGQHLRAPELVESYRRKLFDRLLMSNPDLRHSSQRLFPEAYRHTIVEGAPVRLAAPRTWWMAVAAILASWLVLSTIAWIILTRSTRQSLAVTMNSVNRITTEQLATNATNKWESVQFSAVGGGYRAELPSDAPLNSLSSGSAGPVVAPLLVAVNAQGGDKALPLASPIKEWLLRGSTAFLANPGGLPLKPRAISSVGLMEAPPQGITFSGGTLFFFVDLGVSERELAYHPQLIFPSAIGSGVQVTSVTLYLAQSSSAGTQ